MNCNCIEDLKESAIERLIGEKPVVEEETRVYCEQSRLYAGEEESFKGLALNFNASFRMRKKDGTPYKRKTNTSISVACKYCPICGEPIFKKEE